MLPQHHFVTKETTLKLKELYGKLPEPFLYVWEENQVIPISFFRIEPESGYPLPALSFQDVWDMADTGLHIYILKEDKLENIAEALALLILKNGLTKKQSTKW